MVLATYEKQRDLILLGAYQYGSDPETDYAIDKIEAVEAFLRQRIEDNTPYDDAVQHMINLFD
jgi:type III secretion protein N (ATPase)